MSVFLNVVFLFLNIYLMFVGVQAQEDVGDDCKLKTTNSTGRCTLLKSCPGAIEDVREGKYPQVCNFQGKEPIVCCVGKISTPAETPELPEKEERISRKKCKEYGELYEEREYLSLIVGAKPLKVKICPPSATLIIGGSNAMAKEFPHMALLGFGPQNEIKWLCAGTLISEQFVLTAAHCLASPQYGIVRWVRLGDLNIVTDDDDAQPQEFSVVESIRHPKYKPPSSYHDIALLKMNNAVSFSKYIRPACLYAGVPPLRDNQRFFATGWNSEDSGEMQKRVLESYTKDCNASYQSFIGRRLKYGILPDSQLCAEGNYEKGVCQGDSGGPLQIYSNVDCMYDIVGVTSFGRSCGSPEVPSVFSRVSYYLDWIEKTVWP